MHIMYTINKKYSDVILPSIYSLIENSGLESIHFHIITADFDEETNNKIAEFLNNFPNVSYTFYKLEDYPIDDYGIPNWRGTQIANARLFFPNIIKEINPDIDNLLYIDSDTIIKGNLTGLEAYSDKIVCAAKEDVSKKIDYTNRLGLNRYFNSGVLYFNLDKWKDFDFVHEMRLINPQSRYQIIYPDQDIFNLVVRDEIGTIPTRYNLSPYSLIMNPLEMKLFYRTCQLSSEEVLEEKKNAIILHSLGFFNIKPWHKNNINLITKDYEGYMKRINPEYQLEELSGLKKYISISPTLFKSIILTKSVFPKRLSNAARELSLKLQKARDADYSKKR